MKSCCNSLKILYLFMESLYISLTGFMITFTNRNKTVLRNNKLAYLIHS